MAENQELITVSKEKTNLVNRIRKLFGMTSKYTDSKGKTRYFSYPPKKGFSEKQVEEITEMEISDVDILNVDALSSLRALKKLTIGEGVRVITNSERNVNVENLVLNEGIEEIVQGTFSGVHIVSGRTDGIMTKYKSDDVYLDQRGRLTASIRGILSKGQEDYFLQRNKDLSKINNEVRDSRTEKILEDSSRFTNRGSVYIYSTDNDFSLCVVVDEYPMSKENAEQMPNENLVGILINGIQEVKLEDLEKYPNLRKVFIGQDVQRIAGDLGENEWITKMGVEKIKTIDKYGYDLNILSEKTVPINNNPATLVERAQEKNELNIEAR